MILNYKMKLHVEKVLKNNERIMTCRKTQSPVLMARFNEALAITPCPCPNDMAWYLPCYCV